MQNIRPVHFSDGCSNLANTSRRRNKTIRKPFATEHWYHVDCPLPLSQTELESSKTLT